MEGGPPQRPPAGSERDMVSESRFASSRVTVRQVAEAAGVATSSVSRVFARHPDTSERMRARVLEAADRLGYEPDLVARGLRSGRTATIGFVVRDISSPLFGDIVKGAEITLRRAGYSILLANSDGDADLDATHIRLFNRRRVDGLILSLESESNLSTLHALGDLRVPVVLIDREIPSPQHQRVTAVLCEHRTGVHDAVSEMISVGHRRIALITGPETIRPSRERLAGYLEAHRSGRIPVVDGFIRLGSHSERFGRRQTLDLLAGAEPPTALLAGGAQLGIGALNALSDVGLVPGAAFSVAVSDDIPALSLLSHPLALIRRDRRRMGEAAAGLMLTMLQNEGNLPDPVSVPTVYLPGQLVAPVPGAVTTLDDPREGGNS